MTVRVLTPEMEADYADVAGAIAARAAMAIAYTFPDLDADSLAAQFTQPQVTRMITIRYLAGIDSGLDRGRAAGDAGSELVHAWAQNDNRARARAAEAQAQFRPDDVASEPTVVCACNSNIRDNAECRRLHHEQWHSDRYPAIYGPLTYRRKTV